MGIEQQPMTGKFSISVIMKRGSGLKITNDNTGANLSFKRYTYEY